MNDAASCRCRRCPPRLRRLARGGARSQGLPLPSRFTFWEPGGCAGPRSPRGAASSTRPLPALPPPRWAAPPAELRGRSPPRGPRSRWGGRGARRARPSFPPVPPPARGFGDRGASSAETGLAEERGRRSAPGRFCKTAVTTLCPGCGWGKGRVGLGKWEPRAGLSFDHPPPLAFRAPVFSISHDVLTGQPSHSLI